MTAAGDKAQPSSEFYVLDANFFISINDTRSPNFYIMLKQAKNHLNWDFFISEPVFKEIGFIYYSEKNSEKFKESVKVKDVQAERLQEFKKYYPSQMLPQDQDLSLIILASNLQNEYKTGYIISDDYKLSEFAEKKLKSQIKVLSCSAFLLKMARNILKNQDLKRYFLNLRKQVEKVEIDYVLQRKEIYPVAEKISWLIERAINVSEEKITLQEETKQCYDEENAEQRIQKEILLAKRVYLGESLSKNQKADIQYFYPLLEKIIEQRKQMKIAQKLITQNKNTHAMEILKEIERTLLNLFFAEKSRFITHHTPEILIADELARAHFLHAVGSVQIAGITEAKRFFDYTVIFGLTARKQNLVLMSMLLNALIFIFSSNWKDALEQYELTSQVAKTFGDEQILLKSLLGMSIVQFLSGNYHGAMKNIDPIRTLLAKNPSKSPLLFEELGDIFYALGMTDYALSLYRETLEYQLELDRQSFPETIIEKIRKSFLIQGIREPKTTQEFSEFLDALHVLDGKFFEKYDEIMSKVFEINQLLYEPFPIFTDKKSKLINLNLDPVFDWLDLIDVEVSDSNEMILIIYSPKLGLFGIQILESSLVVPLPENYQVRFHRDSHVLIRRPDAQQQEKYLIRAIFQIENDLELEIERRMPKFYENLL